MPLVLCHQLYHLGQPASYAETATGKVLIFIEFLTHWIIQEHVLFA